MGSCYFNLIYLTLLHTEGHVGETAEQIESNPLLTRSEGNAATVAANLLHKNYVIEYISYEG